LPSRKTANAIFPDERRWVTHAWTVTGWPTYLPNSARRVFLSDMIVMLNGSRTLVVSERTRQPHRHGVVLAHHFDRKTSRADMTLRSRLTLGLLTIAVILIVPLLVATQSLNQLHSEAKALGDRDFAASLLLGRLRDA